MIGEGEKKHYVFVKDFNTLMYDHTLHRGRKHFCLYCLQTFRKAEKLKCHIVVPKNGSCGNVLLSDNQTRNSE